MKKRQKKRRETEEKHKRRIRRNIKRRSAYLKKVGQMVNVICAARNLHRRTSPRYNPKNTEQIKNEHEAKLSSRRVPSFTAPDAHKEEEKGRKFELTGGQSFPSGSSHAVAP